MAKVSLRKLAVKCPHCTVVFNAYHRLVVLGEDRDGTWKARVVECPDCVRLIVHLERWERPEGVKIPLSPQMVNSVLVRPKGSSRPPIPPQVTSQEIAEDYAEACTVLPDSSKAAAALSRRCLQTTLREVARVKPGNLADEIEEVIGRGDMPSYITQVLDSVRNIGNFAAHPIKSTTTGQILPVEPGEAEWILDVIEHCSTSISSSLM